MQTIKAIVAGLIAASVGMAAMSGKVTAQPQQPVWTPSGFSVILNSD